MRQRIEDFLFMCWQYAKVPLLIAACVIGLVSPLILLFFGDPITAWGIFAWEPYIILLGIIVYVPLIIMAVGAILLLTAKSRIPL